MLGRLRMSIAEVEEAFLEMSGEIFRPRKRHWANLIGRALDYVKASARFDDEVLKQAIIKIIRKKGFDENGLLRDPAVEEANSGAKVSVFQLHSWISLTRI